MRITPRKLGLLAAAALLSLRFAAAPIAAQDEAPSTEKAKGNEPPPFDPKSAVDGGIGIPTPYDKFIALDRALGKSGVDWKQAFAQTRVDVDVDEIAEVKVALPALLGFRISDGVMAVKAHDAELLNRCASDIEAMAGKLGVGEAELARAKKIRTSANSGDWLKVFMDLGFLQQDILKTFDRGENKTTGTLVTVAGWLQGARYVAGAVKDHYSAENSNLLREPLLVDALTARLKALPDEAKRSPVVGAMLASLQEIRGIIDIKTDGVIPAEKVDRVKALATDVVTTTLAAAKRP